MIEIIVFEGYKGAKTKCQRENHRSIALNLFYCQICYACKFCIYLQYRSFLSWLVLLPQTLPLINTRKQLVRGCMALVGCALQGVILCHPAAASCVRPSPISSHCWNSCGTWTAEYASDTDYLDTGVESVGSEGAFLWFSKKKERKEREIEPPQKSFIKFLLNGTILLNVSHGHAAFPLAAFISSRGVQLG